MNGDNPDAAESNAKPQDQSLCTPQDVNKRTLNLEQRPRGRRSNLSSLNVLD